MTAATIEAGTLTAQVRAILENHPEGLTDDDLWIATGTSWRRHGSVVRRRADVGAVDSGRKGRSLCDRPATIWRLP